MKKDNDIENIIQQIILVEEDLRDDTIKFKNYEYIDNYNEEHPANIIDEILDIITDAFEKDLDIGLGDLNELLGTVKWVRKVYNIKEFMEPIKQLTNYIKRKIRSGEDLYQCTPKPPRIIQEIFYDIAMAQYNMATSYITRDNDSNKENPADIMNKFFDEIYNKVMIENQYTIEELIELEKNLNTFIKENDITYKDVFESLIDELHRFIELNNK